MMAIPSFIKICQFVEKLLEGSKHMGTWAQEHKPTFPHKPKLSVCYFTVEVSKMYYRPHLRAIHEHMRNMAAMRDS
jgi:hypothetical protein